MYKQTKKPSDYQTPTTEIVNLKIDNSILTLSGKDVLIQDAVYDDWNVDL